MNTIIIVPSVNCFRASEGFCPAKLVNHKKRNKHSKEAWPARQISPLWQKETTERTRGIQRLEAKFAQSEDDLDEDDQRDLLTIE